MRLRNFLVFILVINFSMPAAAQDKGSLRVVTLKEALQMAEARDIRLILSQERVNQSIARIGQNRSGLLPQLGISSSQKRQTRDLRTAGINLPGDPLVGPFNTFDARIQLTQAIFDPAAMARFNAARAGRELSIAELHKTREDVLVLIASLYIEARRAAQMAEYADSLLASEEKKLEIAKSRLTSGIGSDIELKQAQASHDTAINIKRQTSFHEVETRLDFLAALGMNLEEPVEFPENNGLNFSSPEKGAAPPVDNLPDVKLAQQELNVSRANVSAERSEYLPKISGLADYGPSGINPGDSSETYTLGVQASLPIFDGGWRQARVKEAESQVKASEAGFHDTQYQAQAKIIKALELYEQTQALVAEKTSRLAVARQQLSLMEQRLKDGTASVIEFLEAAAQEAWARDEDNEARATLLTAQINWTHARGGMEDILTETSKAGE